MESMVMKPRTMPAGEFKTRCLSVMQEVHDKRVTVVITKRGKPIAKLAPLDEASPTIFGRLEGTVEIVGDIVAPALPSKDWQLLER
jgi:prevent-host-death family protein